MKSISEKCCRENKTHILFSEYFFFRKSCRFLDNVKKYGTARQATDDNIIRRRKDAICMPVNQGKNRDTCS
jgi:hypothetical protein